MKKSFYFAALAVAVLSSCSSDPVVKPNAEVDNDLVPIELGVGTPLMSVTTRGTGTIGSTTAADNHWRYERVRVLMTWIPDDVNEHAWGLTTRNEGDGDYELFGNQFYCLPDEDQTSIQGGVALVPELNGDKTRYYPQSGNSNFFAYYVDDAIDATAGDLQSPVLVAGDQAPALHNREATAEEPAAKFVNFKMNGTQDIMAGMASHDAAYTGFSARSARHGVNPHITMNHLLTRLTFKVVPGHENAKNIKVKSVSVESPNEGALTVAYNANTPKDASELITWAKKNEDSDSLKTGVFDLMALDLGTDNKWYNDADKTKKPMIALTPFDFATEFDWASLTAPYQYGDFEAKTIGHAMFVAPGQAKYPLHVVLDNNLPGFADSNMDLSIALTDGTLKIGHSYEITIVVYGLSEIKVYATLTNWQTGEVIEPLNLDDEDAD